MKDSKSTYFKQYFSLNKYNMQKLWSGIRSIINVGKCKNRRHIGASDYCKNEKVELFYIYAVMPVIYENKNICKWLDNECWWWEALMNANKPLLKKAWIWPKEESKKFFNRPFSIMP